MNHNQGMQYDPVVEVLNAAGRASVVLVCEHASSFIPPHFDNLGMSGEALTSHAAWDPGAKPVAVEMADRLDAPVVTSAVSRLVYDCNRPPGAHDAMPAQSEIFTVPGNADLSLRERQDREAFYYAPFKSQLKKTLSEKSDPVVVTIHSFTKTYQGKSRDVEIGVLHDKDTRLADAMLASAATLTHHIVRRNAPYSPEDGVTHTLKEHALPHGRRNVMIEVRNDLIRTQAEQDSMAALLSDWVAQAVRDTEGTSCTP